MTVILLEECYGDRLNPRTKKIEKNVYLGKVVCQTEDLTPEFIAELKADKDDKLGWKKYRKIMKDKGYPIE